MKRTLCVLLALVIAIGLAACGQEESYESANSSETLVGTSTHETQNKPATVTSVVHPDFVLTNGFIIPVEQLTEAPDGYIEIDSAENFNKIRKNPSANYILMANIDLSEISWECIETFTGILDGNGYTVSIAMEGIFNILDCARIVNLKIDGDLKDCNYMLANRAKNYTVVENCGVEGSIEYCPGESEGYTTGGMAGLITKIEDSKIYSCYSAVDITSDSSSTAGGIVGEVEGNCTIDNCFNTGNIDSDRVMETSYDVSVGGIVGRLDNCDDIEVKNCCNYGALYSDIASGIWGAWDSRGGTTTIESCFNAGEIKASKISSGIVCVSGIRDAYINISNCYNRGNVLNAGICGGTGEYWSMEGWTEYEDFENVRITCCYNIDDVVSGISTAGKNLTYCYYLSDDTSDRATLDEALFADVKGLSESEMTDAGNYKGFDFEWIWQMGDDTYPYPTHKLTDTWIDGDAVG